MPSDFNKRILALLWTLASTVPFCRTDFKYDLSSSERKIGVALFGIFYLLKWSISIIPFQDNNVNLFKSGYSSSKVRTIDFRNKTDFGWRDHIVTLWFENGRKVNSRVFTTLFYGHTILRPSCYECPFKSVMHPGDITIADYWGIKKAAPDFDDNEGVSLVLVNYNRGARMFETVKEKIKWKQTRLEDSLQPPLKAPFPEPENRKNFWRDFENRSFDYIAKQYGGAGMSTKIKKLLRKIKRKLVK